MTVLYGIAGERCWEMLGSSEPKGITTKHAKVHRGSIYPEFGELMQHASEMPCRAPILLVVIVHALCVSRSAPQDRRKLLHGEVHFVYEHGVRRPIAIAV